MSRLTGLLAGLLVALFIVLVGVGFHRALAPLLAVVVLVALIAGGNLLYGRNSHYARAEARMWPPKDQPDQSGNEDEPTP